MASQVMRITLKAYDHQLIDQSAGKIIETVKKTGAQVSGPVPLPTKKEVVTILRAVHKYKDSRAGNDHELPGSGRDKEQLPDGSCVYRKQLRDCDGRHHDRRFFCHGGDERAGTSR